GVDHAFAVLIVFVVARTGLLPMPAHLDDLVRDARIAGGLTGQLALLADAIANVEAGEITDGKRSHRHAPRFQRAVDFLRHGALEAHGLHFAAIGGEHAIADKTVADAGLHAHLADPLGDRHGGGHDIVGSL